MKIPHFLSALVFISLFAFQVAAENEGQKFLDEATEKKLTARTLADLEEVAKLCESAIKEGLDAGNTEFAESLLSATLLEYGGQVSQAIFGRTPPHPRWQLLRRVATTHLERAIKIDDSLAQAHLLLAQLYALPGGDQEKSLASIDKAIEFFKDEPKKRSEAHVIKAKIVKAPEDKLAEVEKAIKIDPANPQALKLRALVHMAMQNFDKAVESFEEILKQDDANAGIHQAAAEALTNLERYDDALKHLNRALELKPDDSGAYMLRARLYAVQEKFDESLKDLDSAIKKNPNNAGAILFRARIHLMQENPDGAKEDVNKILQINPNFAEGLLLRSMISAQEEKYAAAIADMKKVVQQDPDNAQLQLQLGGYYATSGRPRKAVEIFTKVVEQDPKNWRALRARADTLLTVGDHKQAIADYEVALKDQPKHDGMLNNLAWVLATSPEDSLRDGPRSVKLAIQACEGTEYKAAHILSTLAAAYAEDGDFELAKKWSKEAVKLGKESGVADQLLKELESYENEKPWRENQQTEEKPELSTSDLET